MHRNAPLTPEGRLRLCERIEAGWPVAHAAAAMGISRDRAYVWWRRYREEGPFGLIDRSSRPRRSPARTKASTERRIVTLRQRRGLGPARIAGIVDMHSSTVHRVLARHGMSRLGDLDRTTRAPIRRIETSRPGELVHVDVKKLGRIPRGGGWRAHGRAVVGAQHHYTKVGYAFVHSAVDSYSRIAYSEVLCDEGEGSAMAFWRRAERYFGELGIRIERIHTDNGQLLSLEAFPGGTWTCHPQFHQALSATEQRQSRALQSDAARRMGIRADVDLRRPACASACPLAPRLQPSSTPHRRRWPAYPPCRQPGGALHLARLPARRGRSRTGAARLGAPRPQRSPPRGRR